MLFSLEYQKGNFLSVFLYFLLSLCFPFSVNADACGACYEYNGQVCEHMCQSAPVDSRSRCSKSCLLKKCADTCGYSDFEDSGERRKGAAAKPERQVSSFTDCDYCYRSSRKKCQATCGNQGASCEKICISRICKGKCVAPAPPSAMSPDDKGRSFGSQSGMYEGDPSGSQVSGSVPGRKKSRCDICRYSKEQACQGQCGNKSGSVACTVACMERNCHEECLIE
ncbi:MAG TPA: hypothetical protein PKA63_08880 [Oligoflexia bacterium]|nr:hypothetical protein [Oligoflexia bacterium]HMP48765.1 hypothetical protein [Oligoflexia bacterium]